MNDDMDVCCTKFIKIILLASCFLCQQALAANPTQQAVLDYFSHPDVCVENDGTFDCFGRDFLIGSSFENDFWGDIGALLELGLNPDPELLPTALLEYAYDELVTMGTFNIELSSLHIKNISAHIEGMHQNSIGLRHASRTGSDTYAWNSRRLRGGAAGSSQIQKPVGFFINVKVTQGDKQQTQIESAFDFDSYALSAGADLAIDNQHVIGVAAGISNINAEFPGDNGDIDLDAYHISLFGSHYNKDRYYLDAIINYSDNRFSSIRQFDTVTEGTRRANATVDGSVLSAAIGGGYHFQYHDLNISPYLRLSYDRVNIDAFTESGASYWGVHVDEQELVSKKSTLGIQVSKSISKPWGVLIPQARLEWLHEFSNDSRIVNAKFIGTVDTAVFLPEVDLPVLQPTDEPDRDYFSLGLSASAQFSHGRSGFIQYTGLFGLDTISAHSIEMGMRIEF